LVTLPTRWCAETVNGCDISVHAGAVIPRKSNERRASRCDRAAYRERNRVERLINRLKQFRRVATRYEKLAASYLAMVTIAAVLMWL
jgi:transposase